jgi:predicted nucleic acid-binding protein
VAIGGRQCAAQRGSAEALRPGLCDALSSAARTAQDHDRLETDAHAWGTTRQLSIEHDLTLYDAAYLELASRRGHPLATADAALIASARNIGLEILCD